MLQTVLNNARSYLGTQQGDGKHRELVKKYNAVKPLPVGYALKQADDWCAAFVTVIGDISEASGYIGRECGVQRFIQVFRNKGTWRGLKKPVAGDIIVFDWQKNGWADHIGFVEKVEGNQVTTIEGNMSRRVARRTIVWNDWRVTGYARPKYPASSKPGKSVSDIAREVIAKKWGDGEERKQRLTAAGYNYEIVQKEVNRLMKAGNTRKSNEAIAKEVLAGKWGDGDERKQRLTEAGYNYEDVQKIVNQLMTDPLKANETIAREVLQKKWGNGEERKKRLTEAGYDYQAIQKMVNQLMN